MRPLDGAIATAQEVYGMGLDAVAAILVFLVVMAAINKYEFGRFD